MMDGIKAYLQKHRNINAVYFNSGGDYLFYKSAGFDRVMTRDEVMAYEENVAPAEEKFDEKTVIQAEENTETIQAEVKIDEVKPEEKPKFQQPGRFTKTKK